MPKKFNDALTVNLNTAQPHPLATKEKYKSKRGYKFFAQVKRDFKKAKEEKSLQVFIHLAITIHHCKDAEQSDSLVRQLTCHIDRNPNLKNLIACSPLDPHIKNHLFNYLEKYSQNEPRFFFNP